MIGIFDSGSGGLSVFAAIRRALPTADILYFGDTANMPYGNKTREELEVLTRSGAEKLSAAGAEIIVWACNSVSAAVVRPKLARAEFCADAMVEMVGPCVAGLVSLGASAGKIAILATPATVRSGMYAAACTDAGLSTVSIACPHLAAAIEARDFAFVAEEVKCVLAEVATQNVQTVALCCTHYPLVREIFEAEIINQHMRVRLFDPAESVAGRVAELYSGKKGAGATEFVLSGESKSFWKWERDIRLI